MEPCQERLRWTSDFCQTIEENHDCVAREFRRCFSESIAQNLVENEKLNVRERIEVDWGNKIAPQELEKLFKNCEIIPSRTSTWRRKVHWLDFVQMDQGCGSEEKLNIKRLLTINSMTLPDCLSEKESQFLLKEMGDGKEEIREQTNQVQAGSAEPRTSGGQALNIGTSLALVVLGLFLFCLTNSTTIIYFI